MTRAEAIVCVLQSNGYTPARKEWLRKRVATVDPGHGATLEVHAAEGSIWVSYVGRTDPNSVGGLMDLLRAEIRAACGVRS